ncbi:sigma 54-interacting transcriptional regulator [Roseateles noduli]|uniref:sigma 54-interacting transcriptional regulator n=1 Tax=Roseateles noduli TaxID=2052484 RepID=UPI003D64650D
MAPSAWIAFTGSCDAGLHERCHSLLARAGIAVSTSTPEDGATLGLVIFGACDDELLTLLRRHGDHALVLAICVGAEVLSSTAQWNLVHAGARDVLQWPELPATADEISARLQHWRRVDALIDSPAVASCLVGTSPAWRRTMRGVIEATVSTSASVLITGESGTGKELIARLIHDLDPRPDKGEFVVVDCTTLSPELSGSEFFGHERGAFTGAVGSREGAFALAHKGTMFLDEVGELPCELQARLLRAVQERQYKRVGSNTWQHSELRLVSATHRDLVRGIADGSFRADFYYRIAGWQCRTLPLRERKDDVLPLALHFMRELLPASNGRDGPTGPGGPGGPAVEPTIDPAVREFLVARDYPGNVRDLRQLVTRICQRHCGRGPITVGDIPPEDHAVPGAPPLWPDNSFRSAIRSAVQLGIGMKDISQRATELAVEMALECEDGNLQRAAARLGVTDRALQIRRASQRALV